MLGSCWFISVGAHSIPDSIAVRLQGFASALEQFGKALPQEKVYLLFDNTCYYQGDPIWFQCYVVTSEFNQPTAWSKTLYVELLNLEARLFPGRFCQSVTVVVRGILR